MSDPLEEMYELYKTPVYHFLCTMCRDRAAAEELTHDTFIKAIKGFRHFRGEASIKTWLFRIARNTYLNHAQKHSARFEIPFAEPELESGGINPNIETAMIVRQTLHQLSESERTLLLLREQGFSLVEMGLILGQTEGSIKVGIHRAKKKFKVIYEDREAGV